MAVCTSLTDSYLWTIIHYYVFTYYYYYEALGAFYIFSIKLYTMIILC